MESVVLLLKDQGQKIKKERKINKGAEGLSMGGLVFLLRGIQQMPLLQPPHHCSLTRSQTPRILLRGVLQESCPFLVCKSWKLFHKNLEEGMQRIKNG